MNARVRKTGGVDWAQSAVVAKRIERIEEVFGKGETLSTRERELVLDGVLPAWVLAGREGLRGELQERCRKAAAVLEQLHEQVTGELKRATSLPPR